ncbi:hypothetical protein AAF712_003293 [Marasmius tenuissimus]|uniref:F-box domain-containing protein n=1 Tax=Marasmius tenuissimus TaxID=585030 RepID=A0ABR3A7Y1_9AGAR
MSKPKKPVIATTNGTYLPVNWSPPFRCTTTKTDRQNIGLLLFAVEKERKGYVSEINRLRGALMTLENRLDDVEKKENYLRSLLSPIHRMPPEVLMEIFKFCCHSCDANHISYSPPQLLTTLELSMVCALWRNIILATPSLWTMASVSGYASDAKSRQVA